MILLLRNQQSCRQRTYIKKERINSDLAKSIDNLVFFNNNYCRNSIIFDF